MNPAPNAQVYPVKIEEGEKAVMDEPISYMEMYKRKMNNDLHLARLKKLSKQEMNDNKDKTCKNLP